jgi:CheY-like chemotaxis protein
LLSEDIVILDMTMPDIDGAEVLHRLRESGSRVPVSSRRVT